MFELPLASLYANSLLGNLNIGRFLQNGQNVVDFDDLTFTWAGNDSNTYNLRGRVPRINESSAPTTNDVGHFVFQYQGIS